MAKKLRTKLIAKFKYRCFYCAREVTLKRSSVDHFIPQSKGGAPGTTNAVLACRRCNEAKADFDPRELGIHSHEVETRALAHFKQGVTAAANERVIYGKFLRNRIRLGLSTPNDDAPWVLAIKGKCINLKREDTMEQRLTREQLVVLARGLQGEHAARKELFAEYRELFREWMEANPSISPNLMRLAIGGMHFPIHEREDVLWELVPDVEKIRAMPPAE